MSIATKYTQFNTECQNEALRRFGKRYSDLTDEQCADISKTVREKVAKRESKNSRRKN